MSRRGWSVASLATAFIALRAASGQRGRHRYRPSPSCCICRRRIGPGRRAGSERESSGLDADFGPRVSHADAEGPESGRTAAWPDCPRRYEQDHPRNQGAQEHVGVSEEPFLFPLAPSNAINAGFCPPRPWHPHLAATPGRLGTGTGTDWTASRNKKMNKIRVSSGLTD